MRDGWHIALAEGGGDGGRETAGADLTDCGAGGGAGGGGAEVDGAGGGECEVAWGVGRRCVAGFGGGAVGDVWGGEEGGVVDCRLGGLGERIL